VIARRLAPGAGSRSNRMRDGRVRAVRSRPAPRRREGSRVRAYGDAKRAAEARVHRRPRPIYDAL